MIILNQNDIHLWLSPHKGLGTEDFLREVLSHYLPLSSAQIHFVKTPNGKPCLKDRRFRQLQFNASHSRGLLVCAVSYCQLLGVDVEYLPRKNSIEEIANRYFHPDEIHALQQIRDESDYRRLFFQLWTCKEAYIKAMGLTIGTASLDRIGFSISSNGVIQPLFPLPAHQQWHFEALPCEEDYQIAVAQAHPPWQAGQSRLRLFSGN